MKKFIAILITSIAFTSVAHPVETFRPELDNEKPSRSNMKDSISIVDELNALRGLPPSRDTNERLSDIEDIIRRSFPDQMPQFLDIAIPLRDEHLANSLRISY